MRRAKLGQFAEMLHSSSTHSEVRAVKCPMRGLTSHDEMAGYDSLTVSSKGFKKKGHCVGIGIMML